MAELIDCQPNIEERYTSANNTSNLRVEAERPGDADLLIAAGWSRSRLGAALLRLHSEWDAAEKPARPTKAAIEALASSYPVVVKIKGKKDPRIARATEEANAWHLSAMRQLVGTLRMLPDVRRELELQAVRWRISGALEVVPAVVKYWLDQKCGGCGGLKFKLTPDGSALSGRLCHVCSGSGLGAVPCGQDGRRLCNFLDECVGRAQQSIRSRLRNSK